MSDEVMRVDGTHTQIAKRIPEALRSLFKRENEIKVGGAPVSARGTITVGLVIVFITFFGAGVWASTAPLAGAVSAPGTVIIAGHRRSIQHLEGGIVKSVNVMEGQKVKAGDLLITMDPTQGDAIVSRLRTQLDTQLALEARLGAEQSGAQEITFPKELLARSNDTKVAQILAGQRQEFNERHKTLIGTIDLLEQKTSQLDRIIDGMKSQKASKEQQTSLIKEELVGLQNLLKKGLTNKSRVLELQRGSVQLDGDIGDVVSQIGRSEQQITETNMQIIQTRQQFREDVVAQLRNAESKSADLRQQLLVADDVTNRLEIRAPQTGTVQNLAVYNGGRRHRTGRGVDGNCTGDGGVLG